MITKLTNKTSGNSKSDAFPPHLRRTNARDVEQQVAQDTAIAALMAKIAKLEGKLAPKNNRAITLKASGMGRFPVTLYQQEWEKLLGIADQIREFIAENKDKALDQRLIATVEKSHHLDAAGRPCRWPRSPSRVTRSSTSRLPRAKLTTNLSGDSTGDDHSAPAFRRVAAEST